MNARISVYDATDSAFVHSEGSVFKGCLHLTSTKHSKVSILLSGSAFRVLVGNLVPVLHALDLLLELLDIVNGFFLRSSYLFVPIRINRVS